MHAVNLQLKTYSFYANKNGIVHKMQQHNDNCTSHSPDKVSKY